MTAALQSTAEQALVRQHGLRIDAGFGPDGKTLHLTADIFWTSEAIAAPRPMVLVCLPGGGMNRDYFDLKTPEDSSYSFARAMAARGLLVITLDHPGIGGSDRPADGFWLTTERIALADSTATAGILSALRAGTLLADLPPLPALVSVGVGHSMGGLITTVQHVVAPLHEALILLGFSNRGLPAFLPAPVQALIGNPEAIRNQLPEVLRTIVDDPYAVMPNTPEAREMFNGAESERRGAEALKPARDRLLCIPGFRSMIPGSVSEEMAQIDVPVFLGLGDKDIAGPPHEIPASLSASRDVTLFVQGQAGHSHFIFPSRTRLFHRIARWCDTVASISQHNN